MVVLAGVPVWGVFLRVPVAAAVAAVRPPANPDILGVTSGDAISVSLRLNNQLFVTLDLFGIIFRIRNNNLIFLCISAVGERVGNETEIKARGFRP